MESRVDWESVEMHQSERVSSTTSVEEESDLDSWPEDSTSPHDSKTPSLLSPASPPALDFYSESEYDDTETSCQACRGSGTVCSPVLVRYNLTKPQDCHSLSQPFRYTRKIFSNNR